ncbi:repressible alkaline phosphatase [Microdochium bolleyi]|uniref:Alkaline phosphatase n=1 Tax=Microdochium bolleyi TaxID=196109 RepID=A0A136IW46_9PEZI|nr:repressible alkaline phosphatase [Microdochium bolleyi]
MLALPRPSASTTSSAIVGVSLRFTTPQSRNVIFIVPDGHGQAAQGLVRTFLSQEAQGEDTHQIRDLSADQSSIGAVRHHSADSFVTDSAAAGTAFATGFKTNNGMIGQGTDGRALGNILEAAKLAGYATGLVVTSIINHATPAAFSSHVANRNDYDRVAAQQIGYSHPLGHVVDILLGGGRCYFKPKSDSSSCRKDDLNLFAFAQKEGWTIAQDRDEYNDKFGTGETIELPFIGVFNDGDLKYEVDRARDQDEPSLAEMVETALNALTRATTSAESGSGNYPTTSPGYFLMIEASRIDHAGHANDPVAILHDAIMYNKVFELVKNHIDNHPDTILMAAADHETGGLVMPSGCNPALLSNATAAAETVEKKFKAYSDADREGHLRDTLLPLYGIDGASLSAENLSAMAASDDLAGDLVDLMNKRVGLSWGTGGHSAIDTTLVAYAAGEKGSVLKADMAGSWDNTELVKYWEKVLRVDIAAVTERLKIEGEDGWMGTASQEEQ